MIRVEDIMSKHVFSCHPEDSLNRCAQIMWEHDCGCVPVVDHLSRLVGILTDRDVCMGAYTQGRSLHEVAASSVCSQQVYSCRGGDSLAHAEDLMTKHQIRRLPVIDDYRYLVGLISLSDIARHLQLVGSGKSNSIGPQNLALLVESVSRPRQPAHETTRARAQGAQSNLLST